MADSHPTVVPWFCTQQGGISGCPGTEIWVATPHTPPKCVCGEAFSADHELICRRGGYPTLRHNEVRDLVASFLSEVCPKVSTEPQLQPLTGEQLNTAANTEEAARLDVKARGFGVMMARMPFSYPTTTTRHRRIPEECGSLLRQRPNTKSWSAIILRTELTKRTSSSKQNFQVSNQNAHFSEPYNSGTAGQ